MSASPAPHLPPLPARVTRQVSQIVIHCSATPSGQRLGAPANRTPVVVIDAWHAQRGFRRATTARNAHNWRLPSIGYHYVIDLDGTVWTGRHLDEAGAHVAGHNAASVGICLVGGAEPVARYTRAQWDSLRSLVTALAHHLHLPLVHARAGQPGLCGHRDLSPDTDGDGQVAPQEWLKTCPGFSVRDWIVLGGMSPLIAHVYNEAEVPS